VSGNAEPQEGFDGVSFVPYLKSLQKAIEAEQAGNVATTIEDPYHREDFLVSFYGEGNPECGLKIGNCANLPSPEDFNIVDGFNNTYRKFSFRGYQPHTPGHIICSLFSYIPYNFLRLCKVHYNWYQPAVRFAWEGEEGLDLLQVRRR